MYGNDAGEKEQETTPDDVTQDENVALPDKVGEVHGTETQVAGGEGPWEPVVEPTWQLGQDQVTKKEQGFPRPEEAYDVGPDLQKDTKRPEDIKKEKVLAPSPAKDQGSPKKPAAKKSDAVAAGGRAPAPSALKRRNGKESPAPPPSKRRKVRLY